MASFATADELATRLGVTFTVDQEAQADLLLAGASAYIRGLVGQYIGLVAADVVTLVAPRGRWLVLPEGPVVSVASVEVDGEAVTDFQRMGRRLYLADGWADGCELDEFIFVEVTYSHGFTTADELALVKDATLVMAAASTSNPGNVRSEAIDDYRVEFGDLNTSVLGVNLERVLKRVYGSRPATGSVVV